MPRCQQVDLRKDSYGFEPCQQEATERVWCPTWISADEGPRVMCERHARNFKPEFNKYAKDGVFHWGADADREYQANRKDHHMKR